MLFDDHTASQTYELHGPRQYSTAEIAVMVDREIYKKRRHLNVPKFVLKPVAGVLNRVLWWNTGLSADEVEREFIDQKIDPTAKTFKDLGIEPGDIKDFTYHYLVSEDSTPSVVIRWCSFAASVGELERAPCANSCISRVNSKGTAARCSTTSLRLPRRRRGRTGNTYTSRTSCESAVAGVVCRLRVAVHMCSCRDLRQQLLEFLVSRKRYSEKPTVIPTARYLLVIQCSWQGDIAI